MPFVRKNRGRVDETEAVGRPALELELTSSGPAGEWKGSYLGVYDYLSEGQMVMEEIRGTSKPVASFGEISFRWMSFRQRHTVPVTGAYGPPMYLYRKGLYWWVSCDLGKEGGALRVRADGEDPPAAGWEVLVADGKWVPDSHMSCGPHSPSGPCRVTLTLAGRAGEVWPARGGEYRPVPGEWCSGRQVLRQPEGARRYLTVIPYGTRWGSRDSPESGQCGIASPSGGGSCPALPAAAISRRKGWSGWQFSDETPTGWPEGDITVRCDTHA